MWVRRGARRPLRADHREGGIRREQVLLLARDVRPCDQIDVGTSYRVFLSTNVVQRRFEGHTVEKS